MERFWIRAVAATAIGPALAFVGVFAPLDGLEALGFLSGYTWFPGLVGSFFAHTVLMRSRRTLETAAEPAMEIAEKLS